jgi:2-hydroxychromene-2-carboxylate isomerase
MDEETIKAIAEAVENGEDYLNSTMRKLAHEHGMEVAINVMVNLSTTLLAKALLMAKDNDSRVSITYIAAMQVEHKLDEGKVVVETATAILKAMGKGQTCQPLPPKKD